RAIDCSFFFSSRRRHTRFSRDWSSDVCSSDSQLGVPVEACVMVGDTTVDILAAKRAGAQAIGVLSGFGEEAELRAAGADLILPSVAELPGVLIKSNP